MKKIIAMLLCAFMIASFVSIQGLSASATENTSEPVTFTNEELLVEIALAYDRQGGQIRYDQAGGTHRRHLTIRPEEATAQKQIYLDCSSYVNACYLQAFGVNVLNGSFAEQKANTANFTAYAKNNPDNVDVVGYWENANYTTEAEIEAILTSVKEQLQVGDLLVYRHNRDGSEVGHVYIYIGDSMFMHCQGGGSYSVSKYDPARSYDMIKNEGNQIDSISVETIFENTAHNRYLFKATETDVVVNFSLLRPLARGLTPTQESINRMKIAGLSMEKISSKWENSEVYTGDEITYTITLQNTNTTALSGVVITDTLPAGTQFVSGDDGVSVNGNSLTWTGDVAGSKTVTVNYTVRVTATTPGTLIISDQTYVSGVKLGKICHTLSGYGKDHAVLISDVLHSYVKNSTKFDSQMDFVKSVYKTALGIDVFDYETIEEALDDVIDTENLTCYTETGLSEMLVPTLFGGTAIKDGNWMIPDTERTRIVSKEELAIGDIILADWTNPSYNIAYVYAGGRDLIATNSNGVCEIRTIGDDIYTPEVNKLISLLGYSRFAVLRPSMVTAEPENGIASIEVTTPPAKMSYYKGEAFDPAGMVVKAKKENGELVEIVNYEIEAGTFASPQSNVTITYGELSTTLTVTVSNQAHPAFAASGYIINDDFSDATAERPWLSPVNATASELTSVSVSGGKLEVVRDASNKPYANIYFREDKGSITNPIAVSFTIARENAEEVLFRTDNQQVFCFWKANGEIRPRTYTKVGGTATAGSKGTFSSPVTVTFVIDPTAHKYSMWINGTKKVTDSYLANDTGIESISVRWNGSLGTGETTHSYSVDNIKVWEIVKEEASYSGDGYNDGELTNGKVALSLPVSYIPCGTGTEVMVVMAAYDKVTGELITMSEIEKHTFVNGELFFEFTPEITIPETAGDYFVKSMIWRSDTLVPLWKELVLE